MAEDTKAVDEKAVDEQADELDEFVEWHDAGNRYRGSRYGSAYKAYVLKWLAAEADYVAVTGHPDAQTTDTPQPLVPDEVQAPNDETPNDEAPADAAAGDSAQGAGEPAEAAQTVARARELRRRGRA